MEAAIRWSPNSTLTEQCFLLADSTTRTFSHATITSYDEKHLKYDLRLNYRKGPTFRAFDWASFDESIVAVGQWSGEVNVLHIDDSTSPLAFPAKHQRLCNAVTFNRNGLLATGLDRVRNVECLNLWDINQRLSSSISFTSKDGKFAEPYRKFASSEAISSVKFFNGQPDVLVAGVKGIGIRLYDVRDNSSNPSIQFSNALIHNIAIDPLNETHFACSGTGKDTTIQIWDYRQNSSHESSACASNSNSPMIAYEEAFVQKSASDSIAIWSLRYCKGTSGLLGALASNGAFKVYETTPTSSMIESNIASIENPDPAVKLEEKLMTKRIHKLEHGRIDDDRSSSENERIISFDFTNLAGSKGNPCAIILRGNAAISIMEISAPPPICSPSVSGSLFVSTGIGQTTEKIAPLRITLLDGEHKSLRVGRLSVAADATSSISLARSRCERGYSLDARHNLEILDDDRNLQNTWEWIQRASENAEESAMTARGLDLSYVGVYNIWMSELSSLEACARLVPQSTRADVAATAKALVRSLELPNFSITATEFPERRQICLYCCGTSLSPEQMERAVKALARKGQKTEAATLAMIYQRPNLALEALKEGPLHSLHRELSIAIAASMNDKSRGALSNEWLDLIREMDEQQDDPYSKAILAMIGGSGWKDILTKTSLPLKYLTSIALMYLEDKELTDYIETNTSEVVSAGHIEGIILTGLTETSIPLLQNYMEKQFDLQTVVLMLSFTSPRYLVDPRISIWRNQYRLQLDAWRKFTERARFDIQSTRLSVGLGGKVSLPSVPRQITLRCIHCDKALDRGQSSATKTTHKYDSFGVHSERIFGDVESGIVCPKCGGHLPRCCICLKWVGTLDAHTRGAMSKKTSKEDALRNFINVCQTCWHVSHAGHAEEWFKCHEMCPVPGCVCRCSSLDKDG